MGFFLIGADALAERDRGARGVGRRGRDGEACGIGDPHGRGVRLRGLWLSALGKGGRRSVGRGEREHIGQIELALDVVVVEPREPAAQALRIGRDHAGVDRAHSALRGRRVLFLDDPGDALHGVEQDAAIALRIG